MTGNLDNGRHLIFLGGNGHCAARLAPARAAMARLSTKQDIPCFDLIDMPYPGFEDRPRARDFDDFLGSIAGSIEAAVTMGGTSVLYGTGIGGLLALCLRARGSALDTPLLLQAPVLWGLEHRWMPRLMRLGLARLLLKRLFALGCFQRCFVRNQFERPMPPVLRAAFFAGYARCPAAADLFAWLTPAQLRILEKQFADRPAALARVGVWWGGRDRVVNEQELTWTENSLGVHWTVRVFAPWGHYPMIDEPDEWVRALADVLATPEAFPGLFGAEDR